MGKPLLPSSTPRSFNSKEASLHDDPLRRYLRSRCPRDFDHLVRETWELVHGAALGIIRDAALAEDVAQEVFLKVLRLQIDAAEIRSGVAFLKSTARLLARTVRRGELRRVRRERRVWERASRRRTAQGEREANWRRDWCELLKSLSPGLRDCVERRYFGWTPREISRRLGVAERTVYSRLRRGFEVLRGRVEQSSGRQIRHAARR